MFYFFSKYILFREKKKIRGKKRKEKGKKRGKKEEKKGEKFNSKKRRLFVLDIPFGIVLNVYR